MILLFFIEYLRIKNFCFTMALCWMLFAVLMWISGFGGALVWMRMCDEIPCGCVGVVQCLCRYYVRVLIDLEFSDLHEK